MRPRRYYQYVEKGDYLIGGIWKVLHIFFFIGVSISSLFAANAFCEIFDIFNYRCILYAKVSTKLTDITYLNNTNSTNDDTIPINLGSPRFDNPEEIIPTPKLDAFRDNQLNLGIFEDDYIIEIGQKRESGHRNFSNAVPVEGVPDMFIYDDELWVINETLTAKAHVVMTTTVFATVIMCDFVLFTPLMSLITAAVFILIVILFSRKGRTSIDSVPAAYVYVYPMTIISVTMTILSGVSCNLVNKGLNAFCARFVHLTGQSKCSHLMDYFTKEQKLGRRDLYYNIELSQINFLLLTCFWIAEVLVIIVRVLMAVDFQMTSVLIKQKFYDDYDDDDEDAIDLGDIELDTSSQSKLVDIINKLRKTPKTE